MRFVGGQVSFSGGNPLLYPKFLDLYRAAVDRGFPVVILGKPDVAGDARADRRDPEARRLPGEPRGVGDPQRPDPGAGDLPAGHGIPRSAPGSSASTPWSC
ncbi:MAG: hypothetical protein MZV70_59310 [Desulfobacterales bacterium]|nr:hypothetical protein [Desulfobacterales bacterium]